MAILGLVLLILGWVFAIQLLWILGAVLLVVGLVLLVASHAGHGRHYW
jgi:hypothetical protein